MKGCNGANACFLASFSGERGGKPQFKKTVSLVHGITGYFRPVTCGASCAPAFIQWKEGKVLYEIENKGVGKNEILIGSIRQKLKEFAETEGLSL